MNTCQSADIHTI